MKYESLLTFYWFGTCIRYLQEARAERTIHGHGYVLHNLEQLFSYCSTLDLIVTARHAQSALDELQAELKKSPPDAKLTQAQAKQLVDAMRSIRQTLEAEIEGMGAYRPTPKQLDVQRLVNNVSLLFAPGVYAAVPQIAQHDLGEAGKCIAFERPTAAAFHTLRATEAVLRFYYEKMVRHNRISSRMWGPIIDDLRKHRLTKGHEALNNHLDHIRNSFRNPTQHPEAIYDIYEVQDLWSVCADVINRMVKILRETKRIT